MPSDALWERYEDQFPVRKHMVYLNHASVAPLCRAAAEAMKQLANDALEFGSLHYDQWLAAYAGVRQSAARLIGANADEIAIVKNTSEGISTVANGLTWRPGDRVVAFTEEFASNFFPWKRLAEQGVDVVWLSIFESLDAIDAACRGARLLAVSFVQYLSGYRIDLHALGEICARHGCLFLVDAIQGLGAFPIDVRQSRIHALSADGHKWLLGPEGCGILYVQKDIQDRIAPTEFGWTTVAQYYDYASRDMTLRGDAGRYECGTLNTIGCYGLRASIDFLLGVGIDRIGPAVQALADRVWQGVRERGYETLGSRDRETGAGIVSFRKDSVESRTIVKRLKDAGFMAAPRQGWVRVSPHFYLSPADIDGLLEYL